MALPWAERFRVEWTVFEDKVCTIATMAECNP
jgi:hypothetical protein